MLGSERKLKRPEEHIPPRLRRKLPSIKISAEGREIRDQRATYSTAARVIRTAAVAAVMELRMYCQRCYVRYVLRTVSTAAAAAVLPFYAATLWAVGHRITAYIRTPRVLINKQKQYHSCRQLSRFLWDPHPYSRPPPQHLLLASPSFTR